LTAFRPNAQSRITVSVFQKCDALIYGRNRQLEILKKFALGTIGSCSKSIIPPPIGLIHLRHDIPDRTSKVRIYLSIGDLSVCGD